MYPLDRSHHPQEALSLYFPPFKNCIIFVFSWYKLRASESFIYTYSYINKNTSYFELILAQLYLLKLQIVNKLIISLTSFYSATKKIMLSTYNVVFINITRIPAVQSNNKRITVEKKTRIHNCLHCQFKNQFDVKTHFITLLTK